MFSTAAAGKGCRGSFYCDCYRRRSGKTLERFRQLMLAPGIADAYLYQHGMTTTEPCLALAPFLHFPVAGT
jgi:hypothetical protein